MQDPADDASAASASHVLAPPVRRRPRCTTPRARELLPPRGVVFSSEVRLPARHGHRVTLPRAPRAPRSLLRRVRRLLPAEHKRAFKLAAMRDCSRRCVYCGTPLEYARATLDHVHPLAKGGTHSPGNVVVRVPAVQSPQGRHAPRGVLPPPSVGGEQLHPLRARRASRAQASGAARREPGVRGGAGGLGARGAARRSSVRRCHGYTAGLGTHACVPRPAVDSINRQPTNRVVTD